MTTVGHVDRITATLGVHTGVRQNKRARIDRLPLTPKVFIHDLTLIFILPLTATISSVIYSTVPPLNTTTD